MVEKGQTKEEVAKKIEKEREIALKNLKSGTLQNLATAYFVDSNPKFGEYDNESVESVKYFPSLGKGVKAYDPETGKEYDVFQNSLLSSRAGKKRYSGNVSEYKIISDCAKIIEESLVRVKLGDILGLIGSGKQAKKELAGVYIRDLAESKDKDTQELLQAVIGNYIEYITTKGVSESLGEKVKAIKSNLEGILTEPEKQK